MFRRNLQIVSACVIAGLLPMPALAQTAQEIDVPSQPLAAALTELGAETGLQIGAAEELLTGKTSAAVNGAMTPQQALLRLLSGTGLEYRQLATNAVTVVEAASGAGGQITGLGDDDELIGEDIIVEGELQARSVQDTQTSVAVISGEELERRSDPDLYRVVERTPGITQSNGGLGVVIRGIPQGGLGAGSNGDTITVVVDGSRYGEVNRISSTQFSTWDLEQIEVLRGPQSTQSGRNALAGVVNIRSKDPGFEPEVKMRAAVGNGGYFQTAAAFNMPIIEDTLAVRFTTDLTNNDGFISNPILGINDQDEEFRLTLRGGVRFEPTDAFSANLKLTYSEESIGFGELLLNQFPSNRVYNTDIQDRQDTVLTSVNLRLRYDLSDNFWLASETTYFESDINQTIDPDDGPAVNPVTIAGSDGRNIEQEIRLHYESDTITAVIGGFYTDLSVDDVIIANVVAPPIFPAGTIVTLDSFRKFDTQNLAAFGEIEYEIAPGLRL
ncbi:MAG: TonB-dependent receptor, partial [Pseudomonadota bacterium]